MKIYSWNMLFRNRELDRAFRFIAESDFDIFCLQEVPERFLKRLRTLPYSLAHAVDVDRVFSPVERNHLVILSRFPLVNQESFAFPDYWPELPLRTRFFVHLMRPLSWSKIRNRSGLYADVATSAGKTMRVFNLHIALTRPAWRLREFEQAMIERDPARPTVVCGDFNTIESPLISLLNWFVGGSMADIVLFRRERTRIEERFVAHELVNPLRGEKTHSFAGSQLDHILVSRSLSIKHANVLPNRIGSDHHPICVEVF